ncbi:MAG: DUF4386 domain-containing protein [Melioribacteraceae bacterium]|nr:DUF4386 domain-containing protein [Melioribacteraceae bacterium]
MSYSRLNVPITKVAKYAGIAYLIIFVTGIYSNFFVLEGLYVPGDAEAIVDNIAVNKFFFRTGIIGFIIMVIFDAFLVWALYQIFKIIDKDVSLFAALLRLINVSTFTFALCILVDVLNLMSIDHVSSDFSKEYLNMQVMHTIMAFNSAWLVGLIFFGLHLLVTGYLIIKAEFISNITGMLLIIAGFGYLIDSFANFIFADYILYKDIFISIVLIPGIVGELSLTYWLLFKSNKLNQINQERIIR